MRYCLFIILDTVKHKDGANSRQELKHELTLEETQAVSSYLQLHCELI